MGRTRYIGILSLLAVSSAAVAHHSFAMFDASKTLTLNGTLYSLEWRNPHSWFWISATGEGGTPAVWGFEGGSPMSFTQQGFKQSDLKVGTKVVVTYHPLKDGRTGGQFVSMTFGDGRVVK